jgi:stage III sporulation protein AG
MKKWFEKLKKIKNIEIYLAVVVVVIIVAIYFSSLPGKKSADANGTNSAAAQSAESYADKLEQKLLSVIGNIKGAGTVSVIVMTEGEGTVELAYDIDEKTVTQNGANGQSTSTTTANKTPLLGKDGKPIVLYTYPPKISGIVVVATGAGDIGVRLTIMRAVQAVIGGSSAKIEVLTGK